MLTTIPVIKISKNNAMGNIYETNMGFTDKDFLKRKYSRSHISLYYRTVKGNKPTPYGKTQSCKELLIDDAARFFRNKCKGKYRTLDLKITAHPAHLPKMINLIREFEKKVLKLTKYSNFYRVNDTKDTLYLNVSRRWYRAPLSMYVLLCLIKLCGYTDETLGLEENIEIIKSTPQSNARWGENKPIRQFMESYDLFFRPLIREGFDSIFGSSKMFENNWRIAQGVPVHGADLGPQRFCYNAQGVLDGDIYEKKKFLYMHRGLRGQFMTKLFGLKIFDDMKERFKPYIGDYGDTNLKTTWG